MKTQAPKWVCLQLLQECNLRCRMCYEWGTIGVHKRAVQPAELSFAIVERIIQELAPFRPHFDLFGGEPLLYPRLADVIHQIKQIGSTLDIATNGTSLDAHAELLTRAGVDRVWVSLDGPPRTNDLQRGKGTFEAATRGLAALARARSRHGTSRPNIGVTFVVTPANHKTIEETFLRALDRAPIDTISIEYQSFMTPQQLTDYGQVLEQHFGCHSTKFAAGFAINPAELTDIDKALVSEQIENVRKVYAAEGKRVMTKPKVTTPENTAAYFAAQLEQMADFHPRCYFPWLYAEVAASGDVTPCHTFYDLTFGNVNEQPLLQIWRSERFDKARRYLSQNLFPICQACCLYHIEPAVPSGKSTAQGVIPKSDLVVLRRSEREQ